ncbi:helix-turn-helix transcriptional regulator [Solwaraspora sp. WMMD1047]|uniref:helix-turn-helix domain-containing protein n=1 Tax=Solwaraspora sp. WMMD1047 TaxID=3016102 RepID=UPI002417D501|nr:helix-turn-helix transcriptional regulator [Solwaraspora sp. WMMD1047]MDG4832999.1 helix-turn-helix transcriptional regulator [Solwaraspora sp. WMMD1047]
MSANHIGVRVRHWRLKRGLSQRALAELAGFTQGYIAQIEAGTSPLDKRSSQVSLAQALQVSVADLTGQPYDPQSIEHSVAATALPALRGALMAISLDDRHTAARGLDQLRAVFDNAVELHNTCRYDRLLPILPALLLDLHAHRDNPEAATMLVWISYATTFAAKYLGYVDLSMLAAQQCRTIAPTLADPAWLAVAEFAALHALPPEAKDVAQRHTAAALDRTEAAAGDTRAAQVYGMLHLTAAMSSAITGRTDAAHAHLNEAEQVAQRVGERNFAQMWFGPTNVVIWRMGVYAELGEGDRVSAIPEIDPTRLGSLNRQATYYADMGRSLAQSKGNEPRALAALLRAESIAPQRVRLSPQVRETVGAMLRRARATAGGRELHTLARRLGTV